ncbi:hypothetical protein Tdes44962_MAKER06978 [Teratosphaeria destructans]|uniref:Uncharacterized protein n=1 Tax=Teratosphaeria destructans TaxID=418781 RepID=A0A9W7T023_9PEZI|nr:hypothetical protein Tdes44962_MAKER06978 [Teratosphaeria destructans]
MDYPTDPHTVSPGSLNQTLVPVIRPVHRNICKPAPPTPETPRSPINPPATANCDWRLEPSQDDKPKGADEPELDHELWICGVNWPAGFDPQAQTGLWPSPRP